MTEKTIVINFEVYSTESELNPIDFNLLKKAQDASLKSYSPYSNFCVGASILLENGMTIEGSNQENASYPVGICAERVALMYAHSQFSEIKINSIAITAQKKESGIFQMVSPCGICRQSIVEFENLQQQNIAIILQGSHNQIYKFSSIADLLPLQFDKDAMK